MLRSSGKQSRSRTASAVCRRSSRGFSLLELLVSLAIFGVVIAVPMYLLFTMRNYAERQQFTIVPRQTARRAVDYMSYYVEGATDLNSAQGSPNCVITYYNSDASAAGSRRQASYNNLTAAQAAAGYGDEGTDIITLTVPTNPLRIPIVLYPPDGANQTLKFAYRGGCGGPAGTDDAGNEAAFKAATGEVGGRSGLLAATDPSGEWHYVVTTFQSSKCDDFTTGANITALVSPGQSPALGGPLDPPGGHGTLNNPATLVIGLQFVSFRVRNGNLEQKNGIFFPVEYPTGAANADTPGTAFFPIMENVEDLQIAYMYTDGTIWNTTQAGLSHTIGAVAGQCTLCSDHVPWQRGSGLIPAEPLDITNVTGLRLTVVARSAPMPIGVRKMTLLTAPSHIRPAVEDRAAGAPDNFEHYRITTTLMLRNRMLGG